MEQNNAHKLIIALLVALILLIGFMVYKQYVQPVATAPTNTGTGGNTEPKISGDTASLVSISIAPGSTITDGQVITGTLTGGYFFEANARASLLDADKNVMTTFPIAATSDWMTAGPVNFKMIVNYAVDDTPIRKGPGYLSIHNDNPSGMPENDKYVDIPVIIE